MASASGQEGLTVERFGTYVVSEDLSRAAEFYEQVFSREPQLRTGGMVAFDINGALYAIVSKDQYAPHVRRGDNVVPYIKVADIFGAFEHVQNIAPENLMMPEVQEEGAFRFFRFTDPDGNVIELFSTGQASRTSE